AEPARGVVELRLPRPALARSRGAGGAAAAARERAGRPRPQCGRLGRPRAPRPRGLLARSALRDGALGRPPDLPAGRAARLGLPVLLPGHVPVEDAGAAAAAR